MKFGYFLLYCFVSLACFGQTEDIFQSPEWKATKENSPYNYRTMLHKMDTWYDSTYWTTADWTRVGKGWFHPGTDTPAVLCFTAPEDGTVTVDGTMKKLHVEAGSDGVCGTIRFFHAGGMTELWQEEIGGGDATGKSHHLEVAVKKGDKIRFVVASREKIFCDTTGWDPKITYRDSGKSYLASNDFYTRITETSPWCYEAEIAGEGVLLTQEELDTLQAALQKSVAQGLEKPIDVALWKMILKEWKRDDNFQNAVEHLAKTRQLLENLYPDKTAEPATLFYALLENLEKSPEKNLLSYYMQVRILKRAIAFSNPLLDFEKMLFVKRCPTSYNHLVMQYFGWRAQKGGGLFVLENPGKSLACRDILGGKLESGNVVEPKLSFDGKKVIFSYVELGNSPRFPWKDAWTPSEINEKEASHHEYYHIYEANVDGTGLKQLTDGCYEDLMPTYLPDGGIAFSSTRRKGYARCFWWGFGDRWHVYTIHRMNADGSNIQTLSWHDTNEWYPTVSHDGQIFYSRWDYIDRDAVTHQNLWSMRPDGTNPMAVWGNASLDIFCTFQAKPVPQSRKWLLVAAAHHSCTGGSLVLLDPSVSHDGPQALERITPEIPYPEAESNDIREFYHSPLPLSEDYYLVSYSPCRLVFEPGAIQDNALGIYLLDRFGNRELLYRDEAIGSCHPMPLVAVPTPPVLPSFLPEKASSEGRMFVQDIYQGLGNVPRGSIKELRIVQIFPKDTPDGNDPPVGIAGEENGRAILGTVPVEADGSVNFVAPAQKPFLFQALDEHGFAYQTMRSLTYLQPGEEIACVGCHEPRNAAVGGQNPYFNPTARAGQSIPLAAQRKPSVIQPGNLGGRPFSYAEMVQPIWNARCVSCHGADPADVEFQKHKIDLTGVPEGKYNRSYVVLTKNKDWVPRYEQRNRIELTPPGGKIGAIGSGLVALLKKGHYDVQLTPEEWATIAAWIDMNAIFYGVTDPAMQALQLEGKPIPMQPLQ
ncbi:MAG: hypothetical protein Q4D62_12700 [Planctomycetia bacterium]|nr:hypothetical protein [Planctomycetia bacterium]